jgi:membrane protein YdbS with pleckstrin-like domain
VASKADLELPFSALERWVLGFLAVPSAPEIPDGSAASVRVFRAGDKYYAWLVFTWAVTNVMVFLGLTSASLAAVQIVRQAPRWAQVASGVMLVAAWSAFVLTVVVTFLARQLNFRLRWYIVTDRSLRLRSGVFAVEELTMTYRNIQEIRVTAGPLQHALGLATVEVHAAGGGGGGGPKHRGAGHVGRLEGLSNANDIRDLMVERLRQYRDAGLGDAPHAEPARDSSELAAAKRMLEEARALRASFESRYNALF